VPTADLPGTIIGPPVTTKDYRRTRRPR
jgi:hypothetical protein